MFDHRIGDGRCQRPFGQRRSIGLSGIQAQTLAVLATVLAPAGGEQQMAARAISHALVPNPARDPAAPGMGDVQGQGLVDLRKFRHALDAGIE